MDKVAHELRRAIGVGAADSRLVVLRNRAAAGGANRRELIALGLSAASLNDREHLGDDLARLADKHGVADVDAALNDKVAVVQRRTADGGAGEQHGLKYADRGQNARSADVYLDIKQLCGLFLGRIFIRLRPFGVLCGAAQKLARREVIDLDDRAVDGVIVLAAPVAYYFYLRDNILDIVVHIVKRRGETELFKVFKTLLVRGKGRALHLLDVEYEDVELALGGYLRVLLAQ